LQLVTASCEIIIEHFAERDGPRLVCGLIGNRIAAAGYLAEEFLRELARPLGLQFVEASYLDPTDLAADPLLDDIGPGSAAGHAQAKALQLAVAVDHLSRRGRRQLSDDRLCEVDRPSRVGAFHRSDPAACRRYVDRGFQTPSDS